MPKKEKQPYEPYRKPWLKKPRKTPEVRPETITDPKLQEMFEGAVEIAQDLVAIAKASKDIMAAAKEGVREFEVSQRSEEKEEELKSIINELAEAMQIQEDITQYVLEHADVVMEYDRVVQVASRSPSDREKLEHLLGYLERKDEDLKRLALRSVKDFVKANTETSEVVKKTTKIYPTPKAMKPKVESKTAGVVDTIRGWIQGAASSLLGIKGIVGDLKAKLDAFSPATAISRRRLVEGARVEFVADVQGHDCTIEKGSIGMVLSCDNGYYFGKSADRNFCASAEEVRRLGIIKDIEKMEYEYTILEEVYNPDGSMEDQDTDTGFVHSVGELRSAIRAFAGTWQSAKGMVVDEEGLTWEKANPQRDYTLKVDINGKPADIGFYESL